jgi:quercetin dioxygenase-like cupin family protein
MSVPESTREPVLLPPGGGHQITISRQPWTLKLTGAQTAGALAIIEGTFPPGGGAPAHVHRTHEECFYVLDGSFRFQSGDDYLEVGPEGFCFIPRHLTHGFENIGDRTGRLMGIFSPAGYENAFLEISELPAGPPDLATIRAILARYGDDPAPSGDPRRPG